MDEESQVDLPNNISELIIHQRKFLHDAASPLMIAMGMTDSVISLLSEDEHEKLKNRLEKSKSALARISELLKTNRNVLHQLGEKND